MPAPVGGPTRRSMPVTRAVEVAVAVPQEVGAAEAEPVHLGVQHRGRVVGRRQHRDVALIELDRHLEVS